MILILIYIVFMLDIIGGVFWISIALPDRIGEGITTAAAFTLVAVDALAFCLAAGTY
jgi:hypothetical protein